MTQAQTNGTPQRIHGKRLLEALRDAGIINQDDHIRRVVIDAGIGSAVVMYVERYADDRLLEVVPTLDGVEIHGVPRG